jgi:hypothetical protein
MRKEKRIMANRLKLPYLRKDQERGDFQVWIVDGSYIRGHIDEEFTNTEKERGFVLLHELHERNRMAGGLPYSQAHAESSKLEFRCRHHPDELHDSLAAEGWA